MKKTATALAVGVVAASVSFAAPAQASNWICDSLDSRPTVSTVENIAISLMSGGFDAQDGAAFLVGTVATGCPEHLPVLQAFSEKWSDHSVT